MVQNSRNMLLLNVDFHHLTKGFSIEETAFLHRVSSISVHIAEFRRLFYHFEHHFQYF